VASGQTRAGPGLDTKAQFPWLGRCVSGPKRRGVRQTNNTTPLGRARGVPSCRTVSSQEPQDIGRAARAGLSSAGERHRRFRRWRGSRPGSWFARRRRRAKIRNLGLASAQKPRSPNPHEAAPALRPNGISTRKKAALAGGFAAATTNRLPTTAARNGAPLHLAGELPRVGGRLRASATITKHGGADQGQSPISFRVDDWRLAVLRPRFRCNLPNTGNGGPAKSPQQGHIACKAGDTS